MSIPSPLRIGGILAAPAVLLLLHCAHVEPPPGGPEDTRPPRVVAAFPGPGALNVPRDASFSLRFSEWIDRGTGRGQVLLSPPLPGRMKVEVDGDRLRIRPPLLPGGLRPNTTYHLMALATLRDLHGVSMGGTFSLRFSTGGAFDSGAVSGRLDAPARKGTLLAALYRVTGRERDSVLPRRADALPAFQPESIPAPWNELPAFMVPADSLGTFAFDSLPQGDYALLAFEDLNGNLAPDSGFERVAVGSASLPLKPRAPPRMLHLAPQPNAAPAPPRAQEGVPSPDSAWTLAFLDPPDASGISAPARELVPAREYRLRSGRSLTDSLWRTLEARLEARTDTALLRTELSGRDSTEFLLRVSPPPRAGRILSIRLRPLGADSAFQTLASARTLDSVRLGILRFRVPAAWKDWTLLLQARTPPGERAIGIAGDSVALEPIAAGPYRLAAYRDGDGSGTWNPGSLRPWIAQEPYRILLDSLEVVPGKVTDVTSRLPGDDPYSPGGP